MEEGLPLPEGEPPLRMESRDDGDAAQRVEEEEQDEPSSGEDNEEEDEEDEEEEQGGSAGAGRDRSWSLSRQESAESDDSTGWGRSDSMASMSSMGSMSGADEVDFKQ